MWPEVRHVAWGAPSEVRIERCVRGKTGYSKRSYVLYKVIILTDNSRLLLSVGSFIALM